MKNCKRILNITLAMALFMVLPAQAKLKKSRTSFSTAISSGLNEESSIQQDWEISLEKSARSPEEKEVIELIKDELYQNINARIVEQSLKKAHKSQF